MSAAIDPPASRPRGLLLMVAAAFAFAVMNACVKRASALSVPFFESASARALVGAALVALYARARGRSLRVENHRVMALRSGAGTCAMGCTFYALSHMPLAEATALLSTTPLFIAVLGWVALRERVTKLVAASLVFAFVGVVLVLHPEGELSLHGIAALAAGLLSSISMVSLRRLAASETPEAVVVHFSTVAGLVMACASIPTFVMPRGEALVWLLGAGLSATVGQLWMTRAYAYDVAARVGGGNYVTVVISTVFATFLFGERMTWSSGVGIALILACGAALVVDARRSAPAS